MVKMDEKRRAELRDIGDRLADGYLTNASQADLSITEVGIVISALITKLFMHVKLEDREHGDDTIDFLADKFKYSIDMMAPVIKKEFS